MAENKNSASSEAKKNEVIKTESQELAFKKNFADKVMNSINRYTSEKRLQLPVNYSPENALKSAWLIIQNTKDRSGKLALNVCKPETVANALLEMVIMGLNPAKSQCYFIVYGDELSLFPSYFGKITALKRIKGVEDVNAQVIYEGDEIDYEINSDGTVSQIEHHQKFENIKEDKIIGGYCVIKYKGQEYGTISTMEQIQEAWNQSKMASKKSQFKSEFVKRTMVNKAAKWFVNTRDDEDLLIETITTNENQHYDYEEQEEVMPEQQTVLIGEVEEKPKQEEKQIVKEKDAITVAEFE